MLCLYDSSGIETVANRGVQEGSAKKILYDQKFGKIPPVGWPPPHPTPANFLEIC